MIIGITGKTGSGKSTIVKKINIDNKYLVIDVDGINHTLIEKSNLKQEIIKRYPEVLEKEKINRKKLAMILYEDKEKMDEYNKLVWLYLEKELDFIITTSKKNIIIDWMMLPITKYYDLCDIKILVNSKFETRLKRIQKRDNIDEKHFYDRDKNGLNYNENDFDFIINNNKGIDENEIKDIRKCISLCKREK